jgi:hypothetical protein
MQRRFRATVTHYQAFAYPTVGLKKFVAVRLPMRIHVSACFQKLCTYACHCFAERHQFRIKLTSGSRMPY